MSPGVTTSSSNGKAKGLAPPSSSSKHEKPASNALPDDATFFALAPRSFDVRESFRLIGLLILLSPLCLKFLTFQACVGVFVSSYVIPAIIRLRYPQFMAVNVVDDLGIQVGCCMSFIASFTALFLQAHNTSIDSAAKCHPEFYNRPIARILRILLLAELVHNGTDNEKEKIGSWLRWLYRHPHGVITEKTRKELGIFVDIETNGYMDNLNAYTMCTFIWAVIAFQTRFGRPLSNRAKDAIVLEDAYVGMRIGVYEELMSKDYESFLALLDKHLDVLDSGHSLNFTRSVFQSIETGPMTAKMNCISRFFYTAGLMIGFDLLPQRVRDQYQLKLLSTWWWRAIQKILIAALWFFYPMMMWLPPRGFICLVLILQPQLRPDFISSLQSIHSMNTPFDEPVYSKSNAGVEKLNARNIEAELPSYVDWLDSGKQGGTFLQRLLVRILRAQLLSSAQARWSVAWIAPWICLSAELTGLIINTMRRSILGTAARWKTQIKESIIFGGEEIKIPRHIGFVMDGNRRYAQGMGQPVIVGHQRGAQTASNIIEWWLRFMPNTVTYTHPGPGPRYLTVWAFSTENFKRPKEEVDGLFRLMAVQFKSLAFSGSVHLFQMRIRVVGSREGLPRELLDAIELLEETTNKYSRLFLQVAVGYGGRDEIVHSVRSVIARGEEVTEDSISQRTFCSQIGVPPVELIVRTSERRTSGFFLWDTQTAELHFLNKLFPQLTEGDWLDAISTFSRRGIRNGR